MIRTIFFTAFSLLFTNLSEARMDCDHFISKDEWRYDGRKLGVKPGDVVCIEAGNRRQVLLENFHGSSEKPITIINHGGKVTIRGEGTYGFKALNCKFFRITGSGDVNHKYGIEITQRNQGMQIGYLSSDFELDHLEIHHIGFAGIMAKTDPSCDAATWRQNYTMYNVKIHDNYIHHTERGEGLYIGNSFYEKGRKLNCGLKYPHEIHGLKVYNNLVHDTGSEGIQIGCAVKECYVYDNRVERTGVNPFMNYQSNGIQIGEGTGGLCYNNLVKEPGANGIVVLGIGGNIIFNNIIITPGTNGIFCDERYTPGEGFNFFNNTIISPKQDGIRIYAEKVKINRIYNNLIIDPGNYDAYDNDNTWRTGENSAYIYRLNPEMNNVDVSNNLFSRSIEGAGFKDNEEFQLSAFSPAIDQGVNLDSMGIGFDFLYRNRNNVFDIGAFEFCEENE